MPREWIKSSSGDHRHGRVRFGGDCGNRAISGWERPGEHRATRGAIGGGQLAAMRTHDALGDGESEAGATRPPVARRLTAVERGEEVRQVVRRDAWASILNREGNGATLAAPAHRDSPPVWRVPQVVVQQSLDRPREQWAGT